MAMKKSELSKKALQLGESINRRFADRPNHRDVVHNVNWAIEHMNIDLLEVLNQEWVFTDDMFQGVIYLNRYHQYTGAADPVSRINRESVPSYLKIQKAVKHVIDYVETADYNELLKVALAQEIADTEMVCQVLMDRLPEDTSTFLMLMEQFKGVSSPSLSSGLL